MSDNTVVTENTVTNIIEVTSAGPAGPPGGALTIQDDGVDEGLLTDRINFAGAAVSVSNDTEAEIATVTVNAALPGANADITSLSGITGGISSADYLQFDTAAGASGAVGRMLWNDTDGTLEFQMKGGNVTLQVGEEQVLRVTNQSGAAISVGQAVYITGSTGNHLNVTLAQANTEATSSKTIAVIAEAISNNQTGFATTSGLIGNLNTSALTEGAAIWLSPTVAGGLTSTKPVAPNHAVLMGWCVKSHASVGVIYVHIANGYELEELHNVLITSVANNQVLRYDSATSLWKNVTISPTVTLTGAVTGSGTLSDLGSVSITTTATSDPTLTLAGDASGSATFTNLGDTTLTVTVADNSHNHTIANVTGLQTALDTKLAAADYNADDVLTKLKTVDGSGSGLDADLLDGQSSAYYTAINDRLGYTAENAANKGVAGGYASLDGSGLVPSTQLPSYVDDVLEYANVAAFPATGESGKIYVAIDTAKTYRWSGSTYVEISASPGTTDSLTEGSVNLYFTQGRARSSVSAGTGISYNSSTGVITNSAPDQTVSLSGSGTTSISGSYPNFTISSADQYVGTVTSVALSGGTTGLTTSGGPITTSGTITLAGTLNVANGGTGASTFTANGVLLGNGTSAIQVTAVGATGQVLVGNTGAAPSWAALSGIGVTSLSFGSTGLTPATATTGAITVAGTLGVANGGTGTGTAFTAGSVVFAGASGVYSQDNSNLFWDDTNNRLGIGTSAPDVTLHVQSGTGQARVQNTTSGTALIGFRNSTTTDVPWVGTGGDDIRITTQSAERMRIDSSGNVGIGTSSPGYKLAVSGPIGINSDVSGKLDIGRFSAAFGGSAIDFTGGTFASIQVSSTERMRIDSSGNVGIGISTPVSYAGYGNLTVNGTSGATLTLRDSSYTMGMEQGVASGVGYLKMVTSTPLTFGTSNAERMRLDSSGNVGIGTSSPGYKLVVNGGDFLVSRGSGAAAADAAINFGGNANNYIYSGNSSNIMAFATNGSERARIDSSGNVGIGTTGPVQKLQVHGLVSVSNLASGQNAMGAIGAANNDALNGSLLLYSRTADALTEKARIDTSGNLLVGTTSTNPTNGFVVNTNGGNGLYLQIGHPNGTGSGVAYERYMYNQTEIGSITQNGTTAVAYNTTSDYRLKTVDGPITDSGAYIDALKPVQGSWKADGSRFIGLIAHEVQEVSETQIATGVKDGEKMQAMDYSAPELIANLIAELQSLRARVAQLEGK